LAGFRSRPTRGINVDLPATAVNGQSFSGPNTPNDVTVSAGDGITIAVFAQMSGTNGVNDEIVKTVQGSLVSTGGLNGNLQGGVVDPFGSRGFRDGASLDLDDGDLDIGSQQNGSVATGYIAPFAVAGVGGEPISADAEEVQIYEARFTAGARRHVDPVASSPERGR
jgi:hypothetical protein